MTTPDERSGKVVQVFPYVLTAAEMKELHQRGEPVEAHYGVAWTREDIFPAHLSVERMPRWKRERWEKYDADWFNLNWQLRQELETPHA